MSRSDTVAYAAYAAFGALLRLLPLAALRHCARVAGRGVYAIVPIRRRLTLDNLRHAFPEMPERERARIARETYVNLVTTLFELVWTPRLNPELLARQVRVPDADRAAALFQGKGILLLSGHFGNWEWAAQACPLLFGQPCSAVVQPLKNPKVDRLVESYRSRFGNRMVPMGAAIRDIVTTLRSGGVVAMLGDQHGPADGIFVPFLGRPASTYEGPAALALRTGSHLVEALAVRQHDGSYLMRWEEIPTADIAEPTEANILELTRRHVRMLERAIVEYPGQWLWQHKRWKHAPREGSRIAAE